MTFSNGFEYDGQPVIVSEFVGTCFENGKDKGWGYGVGPKSEKEYLARFESLIKAIRSNDGICGYCITQLSDVESEINGLVDFDRNEKADLKEIERIIKEN